MDDIIKKDIKDQLLTREKFTVPEIQKEFSIGYYDAKNIVNELIQKDLIEYDSGIVYKVNPKKEDPIIDFKAFENRPSSNPFRREPRKPTISGNNNPFSSNSHRPNRILAFSLAHSLIVHSEMEINKVLELSMVKGSVVEKVAKEVLEMKKKGKKPSDIYFEVSTAFNEVEIKYGLFENYLKNNTVKTKKEITLKFETECKTLKEFAAETIKRLIDSALAEFKELSLKDIKELKKYLADGKGDYEDFKKRNESEDLDDIFTDDDDDDE